MEITKPCPACDAPGDPGNVTTLVTTTIPASNPIIDIDFVVLLLLVILLFTAVRRKGA